MSTQWKYFLLFYIFFIFIFPYLGGGSCGELFFYFCLESSYWQCYIVIYCSVFLVDMIYCFYYFNELSKNHLLIFIHPCCHFGKMTACVAVSSIHILFVLESRFFLHDGKLIFLHIVGLFLTNHKSLSYAADVKCDL